MTEFERRLRAAMHAAVFDEPPPANLLESVMARRRRRRTRTAVAGAALVAAARAGVSSSSCRTETARPVQTPLPPMLTAMVRRYRPARCAPGTG